MQANTNKINRHTQLDRHTVQMLLTLQALRHDIRDLKVTGI